MRLKELGILSGNPSNGGCFPSPDFVRYGRSRSPHRSTNGPQPWLETEYDIGAWTSFICSSEGSKNDAVFWLRPSVPSYSIIFHHIPSYSIIFHHIPSYSQILRCNHGDSLSKHSLKLSIILKLIDHPILRWRLAIPRCSRNDPLIHHQTIHLYQIPGFISSISTSHSQSQNIRNLTTKLSNHNINHQHFTINPNHQNFTIKAQKHQFTYGLEIFKPGLLPSSWLGVGQVHPLYEGRHAWMSDVTTVYVFTYLSYYIGKGYPFFSGSFHIILWVLWCLFMNPSLKEKSSMMDDHMVLFFFFWKRQMLTTGMDFGCDIFPQVTSYTERSQVPEKLMDGTYVEGLCSWLASGSLESWLNTSCLRSDWINYGYLWFMVDITNSESMVCILT